MSALDAGKLNMKPEVVQMHKLVHDVHQLFLAQGLLKGLSMPLEWPQDAPNWVLADPTRVRQVLLNLLNNALKFTQQGFVKLKVNCHIEDSVAFWTIEVQDSGIGIEPNKLQQLFQRFQQADDSVTRRFGGTGLGLDISRKLARMMHGDINVISTHGLGSTFTATIHTPLATEPETQTDLVLQRQTSDICANSLTSLHILVAEDHPINQKFVGMLLQNLGHQVTFAGNGLEAYEYARKQQFDLILMDVHMPEMDGIESTRQIRQLPAPHGEVPIIALSADVMNEAKDKAIAAGMNAFISKPVQKKELELSMLQCLPA
jgi:CheY-like chemotaxis protein